MELLRLYLIQAGCFLVPMLIYFLVVRLFSERIKHFDIVKKWVLRGTAILTMIFIAGAFYHFKGAMITTGGSEYGSLNPAVGCVDLVGVPYGNHKFLNFLAWLGTALLYPGALVALLIPFYPSKTAKLVNRFFALPFAFLEFITLFNVLNAMNGSTVFDYRNILLAIQNGLILASTLMMRIEYHRDTIVFDHKYLFYSFGIFVIMFFSTLPTNTLATLFSTNGYMLGNLQSSLRIYDLKIAHRLVLYGVFIIPLILYFYLRNHSLNLRRIMLIAISVGCLMAFLNDYGADGLFYRTAEGQLRIWVTRLPIHLCHTALFITPLCVAFNMKRFFYFTYFINVFGALMAMFMPNTGENANIFDPDVVLFWYNHFAAFAMPLLCVALGAFPKPKFKQMLWSLFFFGIYFVSIMFLNAWLSNYVPGYNPKVLGSGTDYLFINNDFIASKILTDQQVDSFLGITAEWKWKTGEILVFRPPYQAVFFSVYVVVAFGMWFIYSLFFRIADSHKDLHNMLVIARKENITMKERRKFEALEEKDINPDEVSLVFENFSKRYGNSPVLSAKNVNLKVEGGMIFGFLGPNGAGKSTCIKSAIGIQPVTEGHIFICGHDVTTEAVKAKRLVGYVPDHYALYEKLTGREYINYIADLYGVSKEDRDARIAKYVNLFELNQAFDNRMQTYSHGMKQKMTIIAALVHNPKLWILDEPLTGLDPQSIFQVKQCMIQHAQEGNIVFFSSHIIDVVEKLCTHICIIRKGQIVYQNDMATLEKEHPEGLESFYLSMIRDNGDLDE